MILENQKEIEVFTDGEQGVSVDMSLDQDSTQMLMMMLSKNLYSDEIGSTVRETASNALDSHRRAGIDKPIIVSLKLNDQYSYEYCVEDFGVGLDQADIVNIISKYGKSLAREEANALGMMGLGFKAPLAYTSVFYFIGRKNGVERKWMMYEGEDGNKIDLIYEQPTEEESGVKIIVPLKPGDSFSFLRKIGEQLCYFEGVFFDVIDFKNDFQITRGEKFQHSEACTDANLHICLDNVYYPIDFNKLGITPIAVPIGLRFTLQDRIYPVPSRESLRYTPEAKQTILNRIREVADQLVTRYNESIAVDCSLEEIFSYYDSKKRYLSIGNVSTNIHDLIKHSSVEMAAPKMKGIKWINLKRVSQNKEYLINEYTIQHQMIRGKFSERSKFSLNLKTLSEDRFFIFSEKIPVIKREYIKSLYGNKSVFFIKKTLPHTLRSSYFGKSDNYMEILELSKIPKWKWREAIKEYQSIQAMVFSDVSDLDKLVVPKTWLDQRKKKYIQVGKRRGGYVRIQGEAVGKRATNLEREVKDSHCKFVPETIKLQEIYKYPELTVYTSHDNCKDLDPLYAMLMDNNKTQLRLITFSDREIKNLSQAQVHNLMTYEEFMKGNNRPFKRLVTAYLINNLITKYAYIFSNIGLLDTLSESLATKLHRLKSYANVHCKKSHIPMYVKMVETATKNKGFDPLIYDLYLEIKALLEKFPFIDDMAKITRRSGSSYYTNSETLKVEQSSSILRDMFKYHKFRLDYTNYHLPEPKPVMAEEPEELDEEIEQDDVCEVDHDTEVFGYEIFEETAA